MAQDLDSGTLFILPNVLHETQNPLKTLSPLVQQVVKELDGVICESEKNARWYLKHFLLKKPLQEMKLALLNEHTKELAPLLTPLACGEKWGLLSDAGMPCIADPGHQLISWARKVGVRIECVSGPSSVLKALLLSGFCGQRFCFHGYLPIERGLRLQELKRLELEAKRFSSTQIFIETPYRNIDLLQDCIRGLSMDTELCIARELDSSEECVMVDPIKEWKRKPYPDIQKKACIFLLSV